MSNNNFTLGIFVVVLWSRVSRDITLTLRLPVYVQFRGCFDPGQYGGLYASKGVCVMFEFGIKGVIGWERK